MNELSNRPMNEEEVEIDLVDLFFYYWSKKWVLLLAGLLGAVLAGIVTIYLIAPVYSSTSKLYVFSSSKGAIDLSELQLSTNLTNDYVELIQSRPVVETVVKNLNKEYTYKEALGMLKVENPNSTRFLNITIRSTDPVEAMDMANEYATVTQTQIYAIMKQDEPSIVENAVLATEPSSPSKTRNVIIGGLLGLLAAMGIYLILYLLDDTIKSSDDIEKYLGINTLAVIPLKAGEKRETRGIRSFFKSSKEKRSGKKKTSSKKSSGAKKSSSGKSTTGKSTSGKTSTGSSGKGGRA